MSPLFPRRAEFVASILALLLPRIIAAAPSASEYYHPSLAHYFITADAAEMAFIDAGGAGPGWVRTGQSFVPVADVGSTAGSVPVCRFYARGPNSHFYTASVDECAWLRQLESEGRASQGASFAGWGYEGNAFQIVPAASQVCSGGRVPVYRYYNQRGGQNDSNHRFTTNPVADEAMLARGWAAEGIAFCAETGSLVSARTRDCGGGACPLVTPQGDPPDRFQNGQQSNFSGYADPSVRKDPWSARLWMAYSWPRVHVVSASEHPPGVDIHLAASDDGGATWQYQGPLWNSTAVTEPWASGRKGYEDHEVANLLPVEHQGQRFWVGARLDYFVPNDTGFAGRGVSSFRIRVGKAASPTELTSASFLSLGGVASNPAWGVNLNLSALNPSLSKCLFYNEPALHYRDGQLYLALRCQAFNAFGAPDTAQSDLVVFATRPLGTVQQWQWRYVGRLAGAQEAAEFSGDGLTQIDLAVSASGKLLAVVTPDAWSNTLGEFVHYGCRLVELASVDPPLFARHPDGTLKVLARATASDLDLYGPGACAYEAASSTGLILVRRNMSASSFVADLRATGLRAP